MARLPRGMAAALVWVILLLQALCQQSKDDLDPRHELAA
jgi:hypothetical protein